MPTVKIMGSVIGSTSPLFLQSKMMRVVSSSRASSRLVLLFFLLVVLLMMMPGVSAVASNFGNPFNDFDLPSGPSCTGGCSDLYLPKGIAAADNVRNALFVWYDNKFDDVHIFSVSGPGQSGSVDGTLQGQQAVARGAIGWEAETESGLLAFDPSQNAYFVTNFGSELFYRLQARTLGIIVPGDTVAYGRFPGGFNIEGLAFDPAKSKVIVTFESQPQPIVTTRRVTEWNGVPASGQTDSPTLTNTGYESYTSPGDVGSLIVAYDPSRCVYWVCTGGAGANVEAIPVDPNFNEIPGAPSVAFTKEPVDMTVSGSSLFVLEKVVTGGNLRFVREYNISDIPPTDLVPSFCQGAPPIVVRTISGQVRIALEGGDFAGVAGVTITMVPGGDQDPVAVSTNSNGIFSFTEIVLNESTCASIILVLSDLSDLFFVFENSGINEALPLELIQNNICDGDVTDNYYTIQEKREISGQVFVDTNGDDIQDPSDAPLENVPIGLLAPNGTFVANTMSDSGGLFAFRGLVPDPADCNQFALVKTSNPPGYQDVSSNVEPVDFCAQNSLGNVFLLSLIPTPPPSESSIPSDVPTASPSLSIQPTKGPTDLPSTKPSIAESSAPSERPSSIPSTSVAPTTLPSDFPSKSVWPSASITPSGAPSSEPSESIIPSKEESDMPSWSNVPSKIPSHVPSSRPSEVVSSEPSLSNEPSADPSDRPSLSLKPSSMPSLSMHPSALPSSSIKPSVLPSESIQPSGSPSECPGTVFTIEFDFDEFPTETGIFVYDVLNDNQKIFDAPPGTFCSQPPCEPGETDGGDEEEIPMRRRRKLGFVPVDIPTILITLCVDSDGCYNTTIIDTFGDGIDCISIGFTSGYEINFGSELVAQDGGTGGWQTRDYVYGPGCPSDSPSLAPSVSSNPTITDSSVPSKEPSSYPTLSTIPSQEPSVSPSLSLSPSDQPSEEPSSSAVPSLDPSTTPSISIKPSVEPSMSPSEGPSDALSSEPSVSVFPTSAPSDFPSESVGPSTSPSVVASEEPSNQPSLEPSASSVPSTKPSDFPSNSIEPSSQPSTSIPSRSPSSVPSESLSPSIVPSAEPSASYSPSETPSTVASSVPSASPSECPGVYLTVSLNFDGNPCDIGLSIVDDNSETVLYDYPSGSFGVDGTCGIESLVPFMEPRMLTHCVDDTAPSCYVVEVTDTVGDGFSVGEGLSGGVGYSILYDGVQVVNVDSMALFDSTVHYVGPDCPDTSGAYVGFVSIDPLVSNGMSPQSIDNDFNGNLIVLSTSGDNHTVNTMDVSLGTKIPASNFGIESVVESSGRTVGAVSTSGANQVYALDKDESESNGLYDDFGIPIGGLSAIPSRSLAVGSAFSDVTYDEQEGYFLVMRAISEPPQLFKSIDPSTGQSPESEACGGCIQEFSTDTSAYVPTFELLAYDSKRCNFWLYDDDAKRITHFDRDSSRLVETSVYFSVLPRVTSVQSMAVIDDMLYVLEVDKVHAFEIVGGDAVNSCNPLGDACFSNVRTERLRINRRRRQSRAARNLITVQTGSVSP